MTNGRTYVAPLAPDAHAFGKSLAVRETRVMSVEGPVPLDGSLTLPAASERRSQDVTPTATHDYEEAIHDLIPSVPALADPDRTVTPLGGGLTNHNYRIDA